MIKEWKAEVLTHTQNILGEGCYWDAKKAHLYWVDIEGRELYCYDHSTQMVRATWLLPERISTIVPYGEALLLGAETGILYFNPLDGVFNTHVQLAHDRFNMRCNDGKCDPTGRLWIGTMDLNALPGAGSLYCLHTDGRLEKKLSGISISNGLAWWNDRMYFIDTALGCVQEYSWVPETGEISFLRNAVMVPEAMGMPDGMTIDSAGKLWVAHWGAAMVCCWDPLTGELLGRVDVPALHVSSCTFGGHNMDELFITTALKDMAPDQLGRYPKSGAVFHCHLPVKGMFATAYGNVY